MEGWTENTLGSMEGMEAWGWTDKQGGDSGVDGAPIGPLAFIVTDSRGNNFDSNRIFEQPPDFKIEYCIVRGATVNELKDVFLQRLNSVDTNRCLPIIVKVAVGINDFTKFIKNKNRERELVYSGAKGLEIYEKILEFKAAVKEKIPNALVGFITVPPISFKKYKEHCFENKKLTVSEISDDDLLKFQKDLEKEVELLNEKIIFGNCEKQSGHLKGCRTISWHRSVCRLGKVKRGKKYQKVYKNDFRELYDGIHGTSAIKQKWFSQLIIAIRAEIGYTKARLPQSSDDIIAGSSVVEHSQSEDSDREDSWDFKRGQLIYFLKHYNNGGEWRRSTAGRKNQKRPIVMPDVFTGEEEWTDWLFQFESCSSLNDWNDGLKCKFIIVRLKGTAGKVLSDLDDDTKKDWTKLKAELTARFDTTTRPDLYKSEFMGRRKKPSETYLEMGNSIRTLARKAYPSLSNNVRDELAKDQFLRGLDKTELALKVRHANPKTLDEAIRMTLEWEAVEKDVKDTNTAPEQKILATMTEETGACASINPSKTDELIGLMTEMMKLMKEDKERTTVSSRYQPRGRGGYGRGSEEENQKDLQCWTYGTARETWCMLDMWETWAHEQRLQPESGKLKQADVKGRTSAKILDPDRNYPLDEDKVETDCFRQGLSIVCSGKIEGRLVDMLVDTGSVYTLISEALWETLRSNLCTSDRYRCAAGSSTNVPSTLELVREQHKVVSANGEPIDILGKTQLRNANLACNIKSAKTEIIPAGHEKIIDGKLVAKGRGEIMTTNYVGIIESKLRQTNEKPVLLARSLVTSQNLTVPLRVANFSSEDVTIYKNTTLGIFSTIDEDFDKDKGVCGALKRRLTTAPILAFPRSDCEFIVDTDASDFGIGAVLSQIQNEKEVVIAYSSRTLSKSERNYCTTRKELLALVFFIKQYRHYLYGKKFRARTDHKALKWLFSMKEPEGQTARWITQLSEYEFSIEHREGKRHRNADGMSRIPCHQCGNDENITSAVNRQFCYVQNDTSRRQQELVIKNDTSAGSGTACCSSRITDTSSTLRDQSSNDSFQKAQQEQDKDIYMVLSWDIGNRRPEFRDVEGKKSVVKDLWSKFDQLVLHNEMLYIRWENARKEEYKLKMVVPRKLVNEILYDLHTSPLGGHLGVSKTFGKVSERFYWFGMRRDVENYVANCVECVTRKNPSRTAKAPLQPHYSGAPFEKIAIDILEVPMSDQGNRFIVVIGDYFSKWAEAFPLKNHTAPVIAEILIDQFISRFGAPFQLHSDQGPEFESRLISELCKLLGIDKTRTTTYHPQSDGQVERFNRTLLSMLSKYVKENQRDWDVHLQKVMMGYRTSEHESTKFSRLMFFLEGN
ncbi:unnamed protein product [Mytilus edulis]|uniref:Integrase catalytic domain-containing protein n=1 Tax=Mytilus edulis TaxID=6550 RepID=A0A8S3TIU0_MYTED|nr:unnamed protein product [Mytilus edulis]